MEALLLLAAIAIVPAMLALLLRVNAVYLFLSTAVGFLFVQYLADDVGLVLDIFIRTQQNTLYSQLIALLTPVFITILLLKRTLPKAATLLHVPLIAANGLALAAIVLPLLDSKAQDKIFTNFYGAMLRDSQDVIVGAAAGLTLMVMWLTLRHTPDKKHKKH